MMMTISKQLLEAKICNKNTCELQERIDKAIDYIHNHQLVFQYATINEIQDWFDMFYKELLDILKGGEENE